MISKPWLRLAVAACAALAPCWPGTAPVALAAPAARPAATVVPDVTGVDQHGKPFRFSRLRGRWVLVFFGYATCPTICPAAMGQLAAVMKTLGPHRARFQLVFVSIDPEVDTPALMNAFLHKFDPGFTGVVYKQADLNTIARHFGVLVPSPEGSARGKSGAPEDSEIQHTGLVYTVDPRGLDRRPPLLPPLELRELMALLKKG